VGAHVVGKLSQAAQSLDDRFLLIAPDSLVIGGKRARRKGKYSCKENARQTQKKNGNVKSQGITRHGNQLT
jgi:hypothetical protein